MRQRGGAERAKTVRMFFWKRGVLAAAMAALILSGCSEYESSEELRAQAGTEAQADGEVQASAEVRTSKQTETGADISGRSQSRTRAAVPKFETVSDRVYVNTEGGSVRIRSACDTADASNILANVPDGTSLSRTGKNADWTRIQWEGKTGYISTAYISETAKQKKTQISAGSSSQGGAIAENGRQVLLDPNWDYAEFAKITSGTAVLYQSQTAERKNLTICVNAGHGTKGGASVKTQCHPDGSPKVTGGTTGAGAVTAAAVSGGMTFDDGTPESSVTLSMALILKDKLLAKGYDVLMIRETEDVQLDNIARTLIANNASDCHIALHWDSTSSNKGAFYMSVPNNAAYRNMEPVKSNWQKHNALGESLVAGLKEKGVKIFSGGSMEMDLTQTSYSTVPSVDIELGDKASDHSQAALKQLADGLAAGIDQYFAG